MTKKIQEMDKYNELLLKCTSIELFIAFVGEEEAKNGR